MSTMMASLDFPTSILFLTMIAVSGTPANVSAEYGTTWVIA